MAKKTINVFEIIKKIITDPRFNNAVSEILNDISNDAIKSSVSTTAKVRKAPVDWASKTEPQLYSAYHYRKKNNMPLEPELEAELIKLPNYDTTSKAFKGRRQKQSTTSVAKKEPQEKNKPVIDWASKTKPQLYSAYHYRKKNNIPLEPELEAELIKLPNYDPVSKAFKGRGCKRKIEIKKERVINWAEKTDDILRKAYKHRCKTPDGIDEDLNMELALRFPDEYDPITCTFLKKPKIPNNSGTKNVRQSAISVQRRATAPVKKATQDAKPAQLSVKLKLIKQSLDTAFYNVYINGRKILRNHANTELKLFADGTILGIHGIVTNNNHLPQRPLWLLYDTNLTQKQFSGRDSITKHDTYATDVHATPTGISIRLNKGNMILLLETERLKRQAGLTRFEIER